jgi:serine protease Do
VTAGKADAAPQRAAFVLIAALAALALADCASRPARPAADERPAPSYAELKAGELRSLASTDPSRALEAAASLLASPDSAGGAEALPAGELETIASEAIASIGIAYAAAAESGDFRAATARLDDLSAIAGDAGLARLMTPSARAAADGALALGSELLAREAESLFSRGMTAPALELYLRALGSAGAGSAARSDDEVAKWSLRAVTAKDRRAARRLAEALSTRGVPAPAGIGGLLSSRDSIADMRSGVVTIRVDRGIKIEQGLGTPDRSLGSGFFIDAGGYILTNYHVISSEVDPEYDGYSRLTIKLAGSPDDRIRAKVVGWDRLLDLALLKVDVVPAYVFSLSEGDGPEPGQKVVAFGSPLGLVDTVTSGIVSAVDRRIAGVLSGDAMQVDVAINPGNSGGPLVDDAGEVVGVAFAGISAYQGLNFAIPSAWVVRDLPGLFRGGEVKRAWLGFALAEEKSSAPGAPEGLEVTYRHPSAAAGIEEGDRLVSIGGSRPATIQEAQAELIDRVPGSLIRVEAAGPSGKRSALRYLGERPYSPFESAAKLDRKDRLFPALFGLSVRRLPSTLFEPDNYSISRIWPGTVADEAGLSEDDPISLKRFAVDKELRLAYVQLYVKKRKAGFLESVIQIPASIDSPDFL